MDKIKIIFLNNTAKFVYLFIISINILIFYYFYAFLRENVVKPITISSADISSKVRENKEEIDTAKLKLIISNFEAKTTPKEKYIRNIFQK